MSNQLYIRRIGSPFDNGLKVKRKRPKEDGKQQEKFNQHLNDENKKKEGKNKSEVQVSNSDEGQAGVLKNEGIKASNDARRKKTGMYDKENLISIFV